MNIDCCVPVENHKYPPLSTMEWIQILNSFRNCKLANRSTTTTVTNKETITITNNNNETSECASVALAATSLNATLGFKMSLAMQMTRTFVSID